MSKVGRDVGSKGTTTTIIHHTTIIHPHIPTITAGLQRRNESMATATMAPTSTTSSDCVIANASHAIKTKTLTSGTLLYTVLETGAYTTNGSQCNPTVYYSGTSRRPTRTGADGNGEEEDASATASISPKPTNAGSKIAMSFGMVIFVGIVTFLCISL
ncbi:hypothetical protein EDC01DRAFT_728179 [Geopyxis carbonaria]|nr:hypothetical protein EDC01DRAFT_728179 [Geopyxis carbonaria]